MSALARRVLTALIALLLGSGVVAAVTHSEDDDRPPSNDSAAISGDEDDGESTTTTAAAVTTSTTPVPGPGTSGVVPAPDSPRNGGGSGLAADGPGEVAGGQQAMADTGAESLLVPGAMLTLTALVLRRRLRLSS